jgi:hypothetical protein
MMDSRHPKHTRQAVANRESAGNDLSIKRSQMLNCGLHHSFAYRVSALFLSSLISPLICSLAPQFT